jgi:quercetin dioxygenase-like cupin family protein
VIRTLFQKSSGRISLVSVEKGEALTERTSAFDVFAQVISGEADLTISGTSHKLKKGNSIVIPAHASHCLRSEEKVKMILTVLKHGYE